MSLPAKIAGVAFSATIFILALLGYARPNLRGNILTSQSQSHPEDNAAVTAIGIRHSILRDENKLASEASVPKDDASKYIESTGPSTGSSSYFVFLQKFPLESTFRMIFHTEVIVCPRSAFEQDASFLNTLDGMVASIAPARTESHIDAHETQKQYAFLNEGVQHYASIPKSQWSTQSTPTCVQLGYGGASCATPCCSVPHVPGKNVAYPLNSQDAVIGNAMGEYKELYLYGTSDTTKGGLSGEDAFNAVCRFYSNKEPGSLSGFFGSTNDESLPKCVSTWAGTDYNPITNNCNTFTSTVLKCVFGLSDAKPHLGVSDMISVQCPLEKNTIEGTEKEVQQCLIPVNKETHSKYSGDNALEME